MNQRMPLATTLSRLVAIVAALMCFAYTGDAFTQHTWATATPNTGDDYRKWQLPGGAMIRRGKGHLAERETPFAYSPDGETLAVASSIGIWLYDAATARPVALLPTAFKVGSVSFSPDGMALASGEERTVKLWDVATGDHLASFEHPSSAYSVSFSPTGRPSRPWRSQPSHYGTWRRDNRLLRLSIRTGSIRRHILQTGGFLRPGRIHRKAVGCGDKSADCHS